MSSFNSISLVGRLTKDPEIRYTQSGKAVCSFTLAVNRKYSKEGNKEADFIPIIAWGKTAELCGDYLHKGSLVLVSGRLQIRSYENKEGQKCRKTEVVIDEVVFLGKKTAGESPDDAYGAGNIINSFGKDVFPEEEIPF